ncbi:hypothetical protein GCM10011391_02400 [Pullulanibacillus camelliae]|uniref:Capsule synthesis protein CapA domain-containing protein n=1 Tax=Pullulanibacillus camelliae TaxID=1707096 RepID=A0A8J2YBB6_9BACL|nr:CapA family protein [Pullulanibacillus camelliae]GGE27504.1 hypothetical protein GCM10011391_02400 [Pullulanibacillus camelliae]
MNKITIAATGDSFITRRLPSKDSLAFRQIKDLLDEVDIRFTNLETTIHRKEGYPGAFSGGTWAMSPPEVLEDIKAFGFNLLSWATNHTLDYSHGGLLATQRYLDHMGFVHGGAGRNLREASQPVYIETEGGRVALIAATSTFHPAWRAGEQRYDMIGRPGVNPLRFTQTHHVPPEAFNQLKKIADQTEINAKYHLDIKEGFEVEGTDKTKLRLGDLNFQSSDTYQSLSEPHADDLTRIAKAIHEAKRQADVVLVSLHSHEMEGENKSRPAPFFIKASHYFIDQGATAIIGHGPHILRGVEIYKQKPIFYSLGNFIFQNDTIEALPADFFEKYRLSHEHNVADGLDARSRNGEIGLGVNPLVWESMLPVLEIEDGVVKSIKCYPISLGFGQPRYRRGWPALINNDTRVLENLAALSKPFHTQMTIKDNIGFIEC